MSHVAYIPPHRMTPKLVAPCTPPHTHTPPQPSYRMGLPRGANARKPTPATEEELLMSDFGSKLLHLSWHPQANVIAAAASNSLYLYYQPTAGGGMTGL